MDAVHPSQLQHWMEQIEKWKMTLETVTWQEENNTYYIRAFSDLTKPVEMLVPDKMGPFQYDPENVDVESLQTDAVQKNISDIRKASLKHEKCVCGKNEWELEEKFDPVSEQKKVHIICQHCGYIELYTPPNQE